MKWLLLPLLAPAPLDCQEPQVPPSPLPGGVTILESQELEAKLQDARRQLEQGNYRSALTGLQKVLDADPAALVRVSPNDLLFVGAGTLAREMLESLPAEAAADRERLVGDRAHAALRDALQPPDLGALRRITVRYAGTQAARNAATALEELLLDRGNPERAAAGRPLEDLLPPELLPELPAPLPRSPQQAPSYSSAEDPLLPVVLARHLRKRWSYSFQDPPFPRTVYSQNHRAAVGGGLLYLTDGREVTALHLGTGQVAWRYDGDPGWDRLRNPDSGRDRSSGREKIVEGFDPKTILAPVLEDGVLLVALQEPIFVGRSESFYRGIVVRRYLPGRRLYAFDAATGEILWRHQPAWLKGRRAEAQELLAAPPAAAAGRAFLPLYNATGTLDLSLLALDLHTGEELWRTFLVSGGRETNLFGNVVRELAAAPPAADAERVLMCSNLGAICALDAATGAALWTRLYRRTWVSAPQSGEVGRRQETFPNCPPAYDGEHFVCTPTDGDSAWALNAANGKVVRELRALGDRRSSGTVVLRHLVGLIGRKAVFTGSHAVIFDLEGGPGQDRISQKLSDGPRNPQQLQHAGTLGAGELLIPTEKGIVVLDPMTAKVRGQAIGWDQLSRGSLQALPGMVLSFTGDGVLALGSPEGLLRALPEEPDPVRLAQALPLIEGLDLSADPVVAARVARAAERLAANCDNQEQRERLQLVAGRARLHRGEAEAAVANLAPLLESRSPDRRLAACLPLIELLEKSDPASALLEQALGILAESPAEQVLPFRGREEPAGLVLWRARARAAARGAPEAERQALLALLMMPGLEGHLEGEVPVRAWAKDRLERLMAADPGQRDAIEALAARHLEAGPPGPGVLRAFSGTAALGRWLRLQASRSDLDRAGRIRTAAWLRDFAGDPSAIRRLVEQNRAEDRAELPALPGGLELLVSTSLREFVLLETGPAPGGGAWLVLQRGEILKLVHFAIGATETVAEFDLSSNERAYAPSLSHGVFLDDTGLTAVFLDRWLRLDADGGVREFRLPGNSQRVSPVRSGDFLALLLEGPLTEHRLQVRDLRSGELLVDQRLNLDPELSKELRFDGDRLYVISVRRRQISALSVIDPEFTVLEAPRGPTREVPQIQIFGQGLAIPDLYAAPAVVLTDPDSSKRLALADMPVVFFGTDSGIGWIQQPSFPHEGALDSRFGWLPVGASAATTRTLSSPDLMFLQRPPRVVRQHMRLPSLELLVLDRGSHLSLYPLEGDLAPRWSLELPGTPSAPTAITPQRGADGWLVPLIARRRGYGAELQIHLIGEDGVLRASGSWEAASTHATSASVRLLPDGTALVRNGSTLSLLGKR